MILYHGTTLKALEAIKKEGLKPRGQRKSNWVRGIGRSRPDLVYLTSCYAAYYASMACKTKKDVPVILKIDTEKIKQNFYPDEEFLFDLMRKSINGLPKNKVVRIYNKIDPKIQGADFFNTKEQRPVNWVDSLNFMGTITTPRVPPEAIVGYAVGTGMQFIMNCDPVISTMNYKICSNQYIQFLESLTYNSI